MGSENSKPEFKRGDVIYCSMAPMPGYHYGIFIDEDTVIDFSQKGIRKKSLNEFSGDHEVYTEKIEGALSPDEIVEAAEYYYDNKEEWGGYNLVRTNCEHFARQCAKGKKESPQVWKAAGYTVAAGVGAAGAIAGGAYAYKKYKQTKDMATPIITTPESSGMLSNGRDNSDRTAGVGAYDTSSTSNNNNNAFQFRTPPYLEHMKSEMRDQIRSSRESFWGDGSGPSTQLFLLDRFNPSAVESMFKPYF